MVTPIEPRDLDGDSISQLYWTSGQTGLAVKYDVTIGGIPFGAEATFNVLCPTDVSLTTKLNRAAGAVHVGPLNDPFQPDIETALQFGEVGVGSDGITWTGTVTGAIGRHGQDRHDATYIAVQKRNVQYGPPRSDVFPHLCLRRRAEPGRG